MDYDVIVIGSGFGGAITACRLAEAGYKVLILERGRRWARGEYPRQPEDAWVWDHAKPEKCNGWLELRGFDHMAVAQGAAVGGGSLIYANISCEAPPHTFETTAWPDEITYDELKPHYDAVAKFMNVQEVPDNQWTERMRLMKEGAAAIGYPERFQKLELAVSFDPDWTYDQDDPHDPSKSKSFINAQGFQQGTCIHLGNCDIGCDVGAKNTLDSNYIPWAEKHGAEVRPLHLVSDVAPVVGGYRVCYDEIKNGERFPGNSTGRIVIVAAGSLGSTELMLKCRDVNKSLPNISQFLGRNWSSNGDFLTPAFYEGRAPIDPTKGPTIASAINFEDGIDGGYRYWIEDGGIPNLLADYFRRAKDDPPSGILAKIIVESVSHLLKNADPFKNIMPWFAQGVDAANGVFSMKTPHFSTIPQLSLDWDLATSRGVMDTIVKMHKKLAKATGGVPMVPPTWTLAHELVTPHPLGGCGMGSSPVTGVVNHFGEVYGYKNLYVADAAIIPEALGVNPSRTIGALAERIAKQIATEAR